MSHLWTDNELLTKPQEFSISTSEQMQYSWDVSAFLAGGEFPTAPSVRVDRMTNKDTGSIVTPDPVMSSSVQGNIVIAKIDGSKLKADTLYRVVVTVTIGVSRKQACMTMLNCIA